MKFSNLIFLASLIAVSDVSGEFFDVTQPVKRLIIDTDAGVDDGVAILNILGAEDLSDHVKVELITTVAGNTHVSNVGRNVLKILKTADRLDIPVYRGANGSITYTPKINNYFGEDGFGDVDFPNPPSEDLIKNKNAVYALTETAAMNPGQLTLVCLGPLTNIALAAKLDPKFLTNLKDIFVLGGSDSGVGNIKPGIEFNIYVDPEAAYITFKEAEKSKKILNVLTWETAYMRSTVDMAWRKEILGAVKSRQVELLNKAERLTLNGDKWVCSDGALSAVVLDNEIVQDSDIYHIDIELCGEQSRAGFFVDYGRFENLIENNLKSHGGLTSGAEKTV